VKYLKCIFLKLIFGLTHWQAKHYAECSFYIAVLWQHAFKTQRMHKKGTIAQKLNGRAHCRACFLDPSISGPLCLVMEGEDHCEKGAWIPFPTLNFFSFLLQLFLPSPHPSPKKYCIVLNEIIKSLCLQSPSLSLSLSHTHTHTHTLNSRDQN
jgi:hypothetical protein